MLKVSDIAVGRRQPANSNFLLFHINTDETDSCPASLFLYFYSTHMFLFKASSAGYYDWCAPPPSQLAVQRSFPSSSGGRPFLSTTLLIFHRETSPFFHSPDFPANCQWLLSFSIFFCLAYFLRRLSFRSWIPSRCQMQPQQTSASPSLLLFDSSHCSSCLRCGLEVGSALRPIGTMQLRHELAFWLVRGSDGNLLGIQ